MDTTTLTTTTSIITILFYFAATIYKTLQVTKKAPTPSALATALISGALVVHTFTVYQLMISPRGINLDFYKVSSLIFLFIGYITLSATLRKKPIDSLMVILFPMAMISVVLAAFMPQTSASVSNLKVSMITHILLSILAYSILFIASIQSVELLIQEKELKKHHTHGIVQWLPPLQTMEELLFDMLWLGIILLSGSILTGFMFLDDMFAQHLAHKTVFTLIAWTIFATLLWGRHQLGWRGRTAVRWTIGGFVALMLAYFGSKFVLELVLHRG